MPVIGGDVDKCWGYAGVYSYRADITATISGNGNYLISGLPVDPGAANHDNDVDGATMMVIWMDATAGYQGTIVIWDGAIVRIGGPVTQTMTGFQACPTGNIANARGFSIYADLQQFNSGIIINGSAPFAIAEDWWNYVDVPTTVGTGQNSAVFGNNQNGGDCYNFEMMGLYWQENCNPQCEVPCVAKAAFSWTGCNPITFNGTNTGPTAVTSWYWDFGDGQTSTLQNPVHAYALPGVYKVCLTITAVSTSGQSCCDQVCTKVIACGGQPCEVHPYFKWTDLGHWTLQFTDLSTGTGTPCAWFWDFGDGNTSTLQNPVHSYQNPGFYVVCLKVTYCIYDASGNVIETCADEYCTQVGVGVVIGPTPNEPNSNRTPGPITPEEAKKVMLYPNPTSNDLFIVAQEDLKPTIRIRATTGQQVMKAELTAKNLYKVNVTSLAPGMYSVEVVYSNGTMESKTFIKD
jgi:PKD repeat protein